MPGKWKEVVRLRFKGERYRDHALDLGALSKLSQFQKMVAETAQELWRKDNPDRERLPKHFEERTRLCLRRVEDGSATVPLEIYIEEDQTSLWEEPKEIEKAIEMTYKVYEAGGKDMPLPDHFPKNLISKFADWSQGLQEDEGVEIQLPNKKQVEVTSKCGECLAGFIENSHEDQVAINGEVLEADVKQKQFQLWVDDKTKVLVRFSEEQETEVTDALKEHKSMRMEVKGRGELSPKGVILRITHVDKLRLFPIGEAPFDYSAKPIGQILEELGKTVPQSEWDKLPDDLTDNLDDYLYGK